MNHRIVCLPLCLLAILLLTSCLPKDRSFIPITGAEGESISALAQLAHKNVLEYVISSSRVPNAPPSAEWKLENEPQLNGDYCFRSGDWTMLVWLADADEENQRAIIIINKAENVAWHGYVQPDGHVVDTAYYR